MTGVFGRLGTVFDFLVKLSYLNVLCLFYSLLGGFFLGIFPAMAAAMTVLPGVCRNEDLKIGTEFKKAAILHFKKANQLGWLFSILLFILYVDFGFFRSFGSIAALAASYVCFILMAVLFFSLLFAIPLLVNYGGSVISCLKNSIKLTLGFPLLTLSAAICLSAALLLFLAAPGLLPMLAFSLPFCAIQFLCSRQFRKLAS
ncbi:DUF624 domain-containing protein [Metabacillus sp. GX 13764]|uniref:YesL family protein n=1 Tax=Metabacillus kandeliae TaxID=2900151 RepID=UPI001E476AE4|nr:DUF624 domain-containing protein [Metabacillus kandeliae]MCD7032967.1 DUF624 domain-containing protein [Metabacillus kandeliae]